MNKSLNKIFENHKKIPKVEYKTWKQSLCDFEKNLILRLLTSVQIATKINNNDHLVFF
jgi:hypothetical protein